MDSIIKYMAQKDPRSLWMFEIQKSYWEDVRDAHKNGKKLIFFSGPRPVELIYLCIWTLCPFFLDTAPTRLASNAEQVAIYIDRAESTCTPTVCGLDKTELGVALKGYYGVQPTASSYCTVPCDSARVCMPAGRPRIRACPPYVGHPFRRDDHGCITCRAVQGLHRLDGRSSPARRWIGTASLRSRPFRQDQRLSVQDRRSAQAGSSPVHASPAVCVRAEQMVAWYGRSSRYAEVHGNPVQLRQDAG